MNVLLDMEGSIKLPKVVVILYLMSFSDIEILHIPPMICRLVTLMLE